MEKLNTLKKLSLILSNESFVWTKEAIRVYKHRVDRVRVAANLAKSDPRFLDKELKSFLRDANGFVLGQAKTHHGFITAMRVKTGAEASEDNQIVVRNNDVTKFLDIITYNEDPVINRERKNARWVPSLVNEFVKYVNHPNNNSAVSQSGYTFKDMSESGGLAASFFEIIELDVQTTSRYPLARSLALFLKTYMFGNNNNGLISDKVFSILSNNKDSKKATSGYQKITKTFRLIMDGRDDRDFTGRENEVINFCAQVLSGMEDYDIFEETRQPGSMATAIFLAELASVGFTAVYYSSETPIMLAYIFMFCNFFASRLFPNVANASLLVNTILAAMIATITYFFNPFWNEHEVVNSAVMDLDSPSNHQFLDKLKFSRLPSYDVNAPSALTRFVKGDDGNELTLQEKRLIISIDQNGFDLQKAAMDAETSGTLKNMQTPQADDYIKNIDIGKMVNIYHEVNSSGSHANTAKKIRHLITAVLKNAYENIRKTRLSDISSVFKEVAGVSQQMFYNSIHMVSSAMISAVSAIVFYTRSKLVPISRRGSYGHIMRFIGQYGSVIASTAEMFIGAIGSMLNAVPTSVSLTIIGGSIGAWLTSNWWLDQLQSVSMTTTVANIEERNTALERAIIPLIFIAVGVGNQLLEIAPAIGGGTDVSSVDFANATGDQRAIQNEDTSSIQYDRGATTTPGIFSPVTRRRHRPGSIQNDTEEYVPPKPVSREPPKAIENDTKEYVPSLTPSEWAELKEALSLAPPPTENYESGSEVGNDQEEYVSPFTDSELAGLKDALSYLHKKGKSPGQEDGAWDNRPGWQSPEPERKRMPRNGFRVI